MSRSPTTCCLSITVALLAALSSCDGGPDDAAASRPTGQHAPANTRAAHPLRGNWSGSAIVPGQGVVAAALSVDARGHGTAVITVRGVTVSESFEVEAWTGSTIRVGYQRTHYTLAAELDGSTLSLALPVIGWVQLDRRPQRQ